MTPELEAFRSVNFDWTRQLKSIWLNPSYHVPELNRATADDIIEYFESRALTDASEEPLGKVLVGAAGFGKTH